MISHISLQRLNWCQDAAGWCQLETIGKQTFSNLPIYLSHLANKSLILPNNIQSCPRQTGLDSVLESLVVIVLVSESPCCISRLFQAWQTYLTNWLTSLDFSTCPTLGDVPKVLKLFTDFTVDAWHVLIQRCPQSLLLSGCITDSWQFKISAPEVASSVTHRLNHNHYTCRLTCILSDFPIVVQPRRPIILSSGIHPWFDANLSGLLDRGCDTLPSTDPDRRNLLV